MVILVVLFYGSVRCNVIRGYWDKHEIHRDGVLDGKDASRSSQSPTLESQYVGGLCPSEDLYVFTEALK